MARQVAAGRALVLAARTGDVLALDLELGIVLGADAQGGLDQIDRVFRPEQSRETGADTLSPMALTGRQPVAPRMICLRV